MKSTKSNLELTKSYTVRSVRLNNLQKAILAEVPEAFQEKRRLLTLMIMANPDMRQIARIIWTCAMTLSVEDLSKLLDQLTTPERTPVL